MGRKFAKNNLAVPDGIKLLDTDLLLASDVKSFWCPCVCCKQWPSPAECTLHSYR